MPQASIAGGVVLPNGHVVSPRSRGKRTLRRAHCQIRLRFTGLVDLILAAACAETI